MKNLSKLLLVSILGGALTLGSYKMFFEEETPAGLPPVSNTATKVIPANYSGNVYGTNADFTEAAERTVNGVVHVKNVAIFKGPRTMKDLISGNYSSGKALQGAGSGVIISPDGYIVTNNHVIRDANEIEITLNNNKTYTAEIVGADENSDIALLKIDAEDLDYIPFGDSNNVRLGEWVLAVGNPFNLKSTVTAGIISATARDLNTRDATSQSFIQTDAAINPGNSGGALVNINGELVGINTAITSQTGSYIGYAFAVPSNNTRKIVEDIMEYGDVQKGILGIRGASVNARAVKEWGLKTSQGVLVAEVTDGSGAEKAGLKEGDIIRKLDNIDINKFSDLTGYINSKRPNDKIMVSFLRDGREREVNVTLTKFETYTIEPIKIEVSNASQEELQALNLENGVRIHRTLSPRLPAEELVGTIITAIDNKNVSSVSDVERIFRKKNFSEDIVITIVDKNGQKQRMVWR
ncbi:trypsin-like peptidase domain-containing protein [Salegentibacter sp. JZCK2]|uniref:S1C family serine protease n=1 Tax=Salegentibacter tibetensis TaxID=2873600 RepID=UPI001CCE749F|nr:trypsin-like peptidase domain-containing protein [Salegentibacter tibetensis]MBZ9730530.1 trypsin-like peptidase domain-containing protein [Salegentibacter tibetensis]